MNIFEKAINAVFGTKHERDIKKLQPLVAAINDREPELERLSDDELKARFAAIRERVRNATADLPEDRKVRRQLVQDVLDEELV